MTETSGRAFRLGIPRSALLSNSGVRKNFSDIAGERRFSDLSIPLAMVTADLITGREVVLRKGLVRTAVLASMSIPGIYPPVTVGDMALVDGGVLNPVPADAAAGLGADVVIAVSLGNWQAQALDEVEALESNHRTPGIFQVIMRSIEMMQSKIETSTANSATIVIEPQFEGVANLGLRSFPEGGRYIALGEEATRQARSRIAAALPWVR
jgi:NTE family protein